MTTLVSTSYDAGASIACVPTRSVGTRILTLRFSCPDPQDSGMDLAGELGWVVRQGQISGFSASMGVKRSRRLGLGMVYLSTIVQALVRQLYAARAAVHCHPVSTMSACFRAFGH